MPLRELSPNFHRHYHYGANTSKSTRHDAIQQRPSIAIEGMLRTSTEMGDSVLFPPRYSRLPRSSSQLTGRLSRSESQNTSYTTKSGYPTSRKSRHTEQYYMSYDPAVPHSKARSKRSPFTSYGGAMGSTRTSSYCSSITASHVPASDCIRRPDYHRPLTILRNDRDAASVRSLPTRPSSRIARTLPHARHAPAPQNIQSSQLMSRSASSVICHVDAPSDTSRSTRSRLKISGRHGLHPTNFPHTSMTPVYVKRGNSCSLAAPQSDRAMSRPPQEPSSSGLASFRRVPSSPAPASGQFYYDYSESFIDNEPEVLLCDASIAPTNTSAPASKRSQTETHESAPRSTCSDQQLVQHPIELPTSHNRFSSESCLASRHSLTALPELYDSDLTNNSEVGDKQASTRVAARASGQTGSAVISICPDETRGTTKEAEQVLTASNSKLSSRRSSRRAHPTASPSRCQPISASRTFIQGPNRAPQGSVASTTRVQSPATENNTSQICPQEAHKREAKLSPPLDLHGQRRKSSNLHKASHSTQYSFVPGPASSGPESSPSTSISRNNRTALSQQHQRISSASTKASDNVPTEQSCSSAQKMEMQVPSHILAITSTPAAESSESTPALARILSDFSSPRMPSWINDESEKICRLSEVTSHDKSTVESLLDRHIECLGLQSDTESSSKDDADMAVSSSATTERTVKQFPDLIAKPRRMDARCRMSSLYVPTSLASSERLRLIPRRLFASMDAKIPGSQSPYLPTGTRRSSSVDVSEAYAAGGWQMLPSEPETIVVSGLSQQSILSGELADIDTSQQTEKFKVRAHRSKSYLRSTETPALSDSFRIQPQPILDGDTAHGLSLRGAAATRRGSNKHRKMKVHLKTSADSKTEYIADSVHNENLVRPIDTYMQRFFTVNGRAELSGDSTFASQESLTSKLRSPGILEVPKHLPYNKEGFSTSINDTGLTKKPSVQRKHSQNSTTSVVDPINTSRLSLRNHPQQSRADSVAPKLDKLDFGPPLNSSTLHLSIPYSELPYVDPHRSTQGMGSFMYDSRRERRASKLGQRLKFRSLRNYRTIPLSKRNQSTSNLDVGPFFQDSYSTKTRLSSEEKVHISQTVPMSEFAFRKHKMLSKFRGWWRRRCMQKRLSSLKRRSRRSGVLV